MHFVSGILFGVALALGVAFGGQTLDYSWGPALVALAAALLVACLKPAGLAESGRASRVALALLALAWAWILWRCWGSPVREFARADAVLVAGVMAACLWTVLMPAGGSGIRLCMGALALLGMVNLGISLRQLGDPSFSWPLANRPAVFPSGLFGHYNHLADFSLVSVAFLAGHLRFATDRSADRFFQTAGLLANLSCVALSGSRGGIVSLCASIVVLVGLNAAIAWRDRAANCRMSLAVAVAMPLILLATAVPVLDRFQERRGIEQGDLARFADNRSRLHSFGWAIDVASDQPWTGGGSRAFGWKKYAAWDPDENGMLAPNDDLVHNELLQVVTDYGWTGAFLVAGAAFATGLLGLVGLMSGEGGPPRRSADALACGGLAAMAGTLVHSNFSFVTHTLPGAMYLGLALGCALPRTWPADILPNRSPRRLFQMTVTISVAVVLASALFYAGFRGSMTYRKLWPVFFSKESLASLAPGLALDKMRSAQAIWPSAEIAGLAAHLARDSALREGLPESGREEFLDEAAGLYAEASSLNPLDPEWAINRANVLSSLGRNQEAEAEFERAIILQGGMEGNFRARFFYARHLYGRWYRAWTRERRAEEALAGFIRARELLKEAAATTPKWVRGKEEENLVKGIEETISFLEGAKVVPAPSPH